MVTLGNRSPFLSEECTWVETLRQLDCPSYSKDRSTVSYICRKEGGEFTVQEASFFLVPHLGLLTKNMSKVDARELVGLSPI